MKVAFLLLGTAYEVAFAFPADCPNVTVIHDVVANNWYGGCMGLDHKTGVKTAAACEEQCKTNMNCSIWQMTNTTGCWSGNVVHGCRSRGSDKALDNFAEELKAGQRLQHGFIKVVKTNVKLQTTGLKHYPVTTGTQEKRIDRCKINCYTDVSCNVWQFGSDGCWVEHYTSPAKSTSTESAWAKAMIAGETIEHTCPPYVPEEGGLPWPWIIAGITLGLLALGAICFALQKTPKVKKTRAVKIEPKAAPAPHHEEPEHEEHEEVPLVYFVPQPTMLIPQQSVVMQQPLMMQQPMMQQPMMMQAAPQYMY